MRQQIKANNLQREKNSKGATPYPQSPRGNRGGGGETIWGFEVMAEHPWKHGTELATFISAT